MILKRTEADVWNMRPRAFKALMDTHVDVQNKMYGDNKSKSKPGKTGKQRTAIQSNPGFIDQIPGW